jgi:predicted RNase H-like nuclease
MTAEVQARVFEVPSGALLWGFAGHPMQERKSTPGGYEERREAPAKLIPVQFPERSGVRRLGLRIEPDDLLDAAAAAATAYRAVLGKAERIPEQPEVDCNGLRMEMVY